MEKNKTTRILLALLAGFIVGLSFHLLHFPLPWILGPAAAIILINTFRPGKIEWPRSLGSLGITAIAYVLGRTMTADMAGSILRDIPWMITAAFFWFMICFTIGLWFAKIVKIDQSTGVIGCMPGGLSHMVLMAESFKGSDPGIVAIIQTSRLVIVLYTVPFLATLFASSIDFNSIDFTLPKEEVLAEESWAPFWGYLGLILVPAAAWAALKLKVPAGEFAGPAILVSTLSILGCPWPELPNLLMYTAQLLIGLYIGSRIQPRIIFENRLLGPLAIGTGILLVTITAAAAWLLSQSTDNSIVTWFLALAPGGLGEVGATAIVLEANVAQVTAYQMFRLFFVLLAAPPLLKLCLNRKK